jgi:hypothetical protein
MPRLSCSINAPILSAGCNPYLTTMPWHPGHRQPALPGLARLSRVRRRLRCLYPWPGPARRMQRAAAHRPGPAGHHPGDLAALTAPRPARPDVKAPAGLAQLHGTTEQVRPGILRWPHCACLLPLGNGLSSSPSAGPGQRSLLRKVNIAIMPEPFKVRMPNRVGQLPWSSCQLPRPEQPVTGFICCRSGRLGPGGR